MRYFSIINTTQLNSLQKQQVEYHNEKILIKYTFQGIKTPLSLYLR